MNVPFILADANLDKTFAKEADAAGLVALAGRKRVRHLRPCEKALSHENCKYLHHHNQKLIFLYRLRQNSEQRHK